MGQGKRKHKPGAEGKSALLTKDSREAICGCIAVGVSLQCAAETQGITGRTLKRWLARGRAALEAAANVAPDLIERDGDLLKLVDVEEQPYVRLVFEVDRATARAEAHYTQRLYLAEDWRAAAWWLERRRSRDYGQRQHLTVQREPSTMTNEELIVELRELGFSPVEAHGPVLPASGEPNDTPPDPDRNGNG